MEKPASPKARRLADYGFFAVLLVAAFFFWRTIHTVVVPVILGAFAAVLARPTADRLTALFHGRRKVASGVTTTLVTLLVVLPAAFLLYVLVQEAIGAATRVTNLLAHDGLRGMLARLPIPRRIRNAITPEQLQALSTSLATRAGALMTRLVAAGASLLMGGFLFVVSLYYFLIDGSRWISEVSRIAPIHARYVRAFSREFDNVAHALFFGSLVTALVQGAVAAVGYLIFGVPQPILWGATTAVMSLTPIVGTTVVWLPVAVVLLLTGHVWQGIAVLLWNAFLTGSIDNVIRPMLMKGRMRLHPLVVFLSIMGGIEAFGMIGLLLGPLAAAFFLAAVRIYDRDYREELDPT